MYDAHLKSKKHIKAAKAMMEQGVVEVDNEMREKLRKQTEDEKENKERQTAFTEALIQKYAEILGTQREDTKANVERKRALTDRERRVSWYNYARARVGVRLGKKIINFVISD